MLEGETSDEQRDDQEISVQRSGSSVHTRPIRSSPRVSQICPGPPKAIRQPRSLLTSSPGAFNDFSVPRTSSAATARRDVGATTCAVPCGQRRRRRNGTARHRGEPHVPCRWCSTQSLRNAQGFCPILRGFRLTSRVQFTWRSFGPSADNGFETGAGFLQKTIAGFYVL